MQPGICTYLDLAPVYRSQALHYHSASIWKCLPVLCARQGLESIVSCMKSLKIVEIKTHSNSVLLRQLLGNVDIPGVISAEELSSRRWILRSHTKY